MVCKMEFPLGARPIFRGYMLVSIRVSPEKSWLFLDLMQRIQHIKKTDSWHLGSEKVGKIFRFHPADHLLNARNLKDSSDHLFFENRKTKYQNVGLFPFLLWYWRLIVSIAQGPDMNVLFLFKISFLNVQVLHFYLPVNRGLFEKNMLLHFRMRTPPRRDFPSCDPKGARVFLMVNSESWGQLRIPRYKWWFEQCSTTLVGCLIKGDEILPKPILWGF